MNRAFASILCEDVAGTAQFYQDLLGMTRAADFGWFIILTHGNVPGYELGILDRTHDTIPDGVPLHPAGTILTFVVDDVEAIHRRAAVLQVNILQAPTDLPYGQRRLMLRDPAGTAVDVSSPIR